MGKTRLSQIIIVTSIFIGGMVVGIFLGSVLIKETAFNQGLIEGKKQIEDKYQKKIKELFPVRPEPDEIFAVSGKITEIKEKTLILETTFYPVNPFQEPKTETKLVKVADTTKIVKEVAKSPEELAKEEKAYAEAIEEAVETIELELLIPTPFKDIVIEFTELKIGDEIVVETEENIKGKDEFFAKKIIVQSY